MAYPNFEQYNQAFQAHQKLLADPELQRGAVAKTGLGLPLAISGGFALTYTITTGSKKFAVRCFHRESKAIERRYSAIARRLAQLRSHYFVDFQYQAQGIRIDGAAYPVVKMAWAHGETLGEFLEVKHRHGAALANLPASLLVLSNFLEREQLAHGDLSTGNIMVSGTSGAIQLIDYDGMFVEEIRGLGSSELGNINFQHPDRKTKNPFGPTMDRFSLISLSLAVKALHEDPSLWDKSKSDLDAIVFRANDFIDPASSAVFSELMRKPALAKHAEHFAAVCQAPFDKTPTLQDFLAGRNIPFGVVSISITPQEARQKSGYMGVYDVLSATNYEACLKRVGDKVEVIGKIVAVKEDKARNGKPYVFINFGDWKGQIFKIAIWSEGLAAISKRPDASWAGKWVSVVGLMEPPFRNKKYNYSHLSINISANGQMTVIAETEANWRLAPPSSKAPAPRTSNRNALDSIKGKPSPSQARPPPPLSSSSNKNVLDNIRRAQTGSRPGSTQTTAPARPQAPAARPSYQTPPEKGLVAKLVDWLFG